MRAAGHTSSTSHSGVDVVALAEAAGVSYEMARRYAEGLAMPRPATVESIAEWLQLSPGSLAYSPAHSGAAAATIDERELERCIAATIEAARRSGREVPPGTLAKVAVVLYMEAIAGRQTPTPTIETLLRAI